MRKSEQIEDGTMVTAVIQVHEPAPSHIAVGVAIRVMPWASITSLFRRTLVDFILFYDVTPEYIVRRGDHRAEHLRLAWEYADRSELLLAGRWKIRWIALS